MSVGGVRRSHWPASLPSLSASAGMRATRWALNTYRPGAGFPTRSGIPIFCSDTP